MGLLSWITGGTKAAENVTEIGSKITSGIVSGIDALVLTDEERIQYSQAGVDQVLKFWGTFGTENCEQSKARREIAKAVMKVWLSLILMAVAVYGFNPEIASFIFGVIKEITWLVGMIAGTYFVPHQLQKIWKGGGTKND